MKRIYLLTAAAVLSLPLLCGCNDKEEDEMVIWDFMPSEIVIHVENAAGDNLLLPETAGSIVPEDVKAVYNGKTYDYTYTYVEDGKPVPYQPGAMDDRQKTRECAPIWYGLHDGYTEGDYEPTINFGQFAPTDNYRNEEFEIVWPDGSRDKIAFDLFINWDDRNNPQYVKNLYLNGKPVDSIVIVK